MSRHAEHRHLAFALTLTLVTLAATATAGGTQAGSAPNVDRLLVVAYAPPTYHPVAHVYDLTGRLLHTVQAAAGTSLTWSPDGTKIAVTAGSGYAGPAGVWVERADGSGRRKLITTRTGCLSTCQSIPTVAWTPDGKQLAVGGVDPNTTGFQLITVATGRMKALTKPRRFVFHSPIAYSPDNKYLSEALTAGNGGTASCCVSELLVRRADGGAPRVLHKFGDPIHDGPGAATWSPDASQIAFTDDGRDLRDPRLAIVDVQSGQLHPLDAHNAYDQGPAWSPDGKALALPQSTGPVFTVGTDGSSFQTLSVTGTAVLWLHNGDLVIAAGKTGHQIAIVHNGLVQTTFTLPRQEQAFSLHEAQ